MYIHIYIYMYADVHVYTHTCHVHAVFTHIYVDIHTHIHIHTYAHVHVWYTRQSCICVFTHTSRLTPIFGGTAAWKRKPPSTHSYFLFLSPPLPPPPPPLATYCQQNSVHKLIWKTSCAIYTLHPPHPRSRQNVTSNMSLIPRLNWRELSRLCCRMPSAPCTTHTRVTTHTRDKTHDKTRKLTATHTEKATSGS